MEVANDTLTIAADGKEVAKIEQEEKAALIVEYDGKVILKITHDLKLLDAFDNDVSGNAEVLGNALKCIADGLRGSAIHNGS